MGRKLFWDALLEIPVGVSNSWNETIFKLVCVLIYICLEPVFIQNQRLFLRVNVQMSSKSKYTVSISPALSL